MVGHHVLLLLHWSPVLGPVGTRTRVEEVTILGVTKTVQVFKLVWAKNCPSTILGITKAVQVFKLGGA